jgi:hypothetical protein
LEKNVSPQNCQKMTVFPKKYGSKNATILADKKIVISNPNFCEKKIT